MCTWIMMRTFAYLFVCLVICALVSPYQARAGRATANIIQEGKVFRLYHRELLAFFCNFQRLSGAVHFFQELWWRRCGCGHLQHFKVWMYVYLLVLLLFIHFWLRHSKGTSMKSFKGTPVHDQFVSRLAARGLIMNCANAIRLQVCKLD